MRNRGGNLPADHQRDGSVRTLRHALSDVRCDLRLGRVRRVHRRRDVRRRGERVARVRRVRDADAFVQRRLRVVVVRAVHRRRSLHGGRDDERWMWRVPGPHLFRELHAPHRVRFVHLHRVVSVRVELSVGLPPERVWV